jgi:hypothetical protein
MRMNNRQCHGDRRDREPSSPETARGMEAESRQFGTKKQKGSALEVRGFAMMMSRAAHSHIYSFFTAIRARSFLHIYTNTPTFHFHSLSRP